MSMNTAQRLWLLLVFFIILLNRLFYYVNKLVKLLIYYSVIYSACIASSADKPVEESMKAVQAVTVVAGHKRESTESDVDGPSRKKTAHGMYCVASYCSLGH